MVRNVQQGGNLSNVFKAKAENIHVYVFACVPALKQYSHHLEGAVRCLDEPELSNVVSWETVDCGAAKASLHQTDWLR